MKKRKLKGFVLPTVYIAIMAVLFITISFLGRSLQNHIAYDNLTVSAFTDDVTPVVSTQDVGEKINKPFVDEDVTISKAYYDMNDDVKKQQQSLIFYKNTYLQNSGVLYTAKEKFDIQTVLSGTVTRIDEDEILGKVVEVSHNANLKTVYYSLGDISVKKDDKLENGAVIGKSGDNNLTDESENCLLFEVYYNGTTIDPEDFYQMNIEDLQ